jgi:hypothetical protein
MTYACPAWEFAVENHIMKLQFLQNMVSAEERFGYFMQDGAQVRKLPEHYAACLVK